MINKVEITGVNTSNLPVLSNEEKQELLIKIKNGDKEAREKFISRQFKIGTFCYKAIFAENGNSADDLFQIGCIRFDKSNR